MVEANQIRKPATKDENEDQLTVDQQFFTARYIGEEARWLQTIANRDKLPNVSKILRRVVLETEAITGKLDSAEQNSKGNDDGKLEVI